MKAQTSRDVIHDNNMSGSEVVLSITDEEEAAVRTLFISGLPPDIRPRELYLLFRSYKGYESSLLKIMPGKNGKPSTVAFATFKTHSAAEEAKSDLQGVQFDPELPQTLRLEFAHSNTKVSHPKQQTSPLPGLVFPSNNGCSSNSCSNEAMLCSILNAGGGGTGPGYYSHTNLMGSADPSTVAWSTSGIQFQAAVAAASPAAVYTPAALTSCSSGVLQQHSAALLPHTAHILAQMPLTIHPGALVPAGFTAHHSTLSLSTLPPGVYTSSSLPGQSAGAYTPSSLPGQCAGGSTPCSTLFVANLGPTVTEAELRDLFDGFSGFRRVQLHTKGGSPVAFVEFQGFEESTRYHPYRKQCLTDKGIQCATKAMTQLQGVIIRSCDRGGIRIEYAKSKMGRFNHREGSERRKNSLNLSSASSSSLST